MGLILAWSGSADRELRVSSPLSCPSLSPHLTTSFSREVEGRDRWAEGNTRLTAEEEATETGRAKESRRETKKGPDRRKRNRKNAGRMTSRQANRKGADSHVNTADALFAQV